MIGIALIFDGTGPRFDLLVPVIDFRATVQNGLVNLGTRQGSDAIYPERGTRLLLDAAAGKMVNEAWANHAAAFSALRTLSFLQNTDEPGNPKGMANLKLTTQQLQGQQLTLAVGATSNLGENIGSTATM